MAEKNNDEISAFDFGSVKTEWFNYYGISYSSDSYLNLSNTSVNTAKPAADVSTPNLLTRLSYLPPERTFLGTPWIKPWKRRPL